MPGRIAAQVVATESVQTVLLLVGAVVITVVGYLKIGGLGANFLARSRPFLPASARRRWLL